MSVELLLTVTKPKMNSYKNKNHNNKINNNNSYKKKTSKQSGCDPILISLVYVLISFAGLIFEMLILINWPLSCWKYLQCVNLNF